MRRTLLCLAVVGTMVGAYGLSRVVAGQEVQKRAKKPKDVNVVQTEPLDVFVSSLPPVEVSALPAVDVATLPAVTVSALPAVDVSSLPDVTIANASLDVRVTNAELATTAPATRTITLSDLNSVTLTQETVSAAIDCDGYRNVSVFVGHDEYVGTAIKMAIEFECGGVWAWQGSDVGDVDVYSHRQSLTTYEVLGSQMRVHFRGGATFPTVTGVKVVVYLRP